MSSTLKRQNHRIHPCNAPRKNALLSHLIEHYSNKSILIVTAGDPGSLQVPQEKNVTVVSDETLAQSAELKCDVLISYDLPDKAIIYMSRLARASEYALILLAAEDQKYLYPIETLWGRTIVQEPISGFEPDFGIAVEQKSKEEAKARRAERDAENAKRDAAQPKRDYKSRSDKPRSDFKRDERGGRDDDRPSRKPFSDSRGTYNSSTRDKKDFKPKFIGKDENGKPIFEGKTRERNHYIDGTPRSDAEKANKTRYSSKPKFFGKDEKSSSQSKPFEGEKKAYDGKKPYEKKPFDKEGKKPSGEKKPYGEKKPFGDKKSFGDKKPYGEKKPFGDKKPASNYAKPAQSESASPKRPPRRINVKSLKPSEDKQ